MGSLSDLSTFCLHLVNKYGRPDLASEEQKAEEFRQVYFGDLPVNKRTLGAVARACGLSISARPMPHNVRGYHEMVGGRMSLYYREDDCKRGIENTIPHEIREMMEHVCADLCPDYRPLRTSAVHLAANRFATALLLPRDEYRSRAYQTGFDVIALGKLYPRSYSQLLLRIGEVVEGELFLYGALYELVPYPGASDPRMVVTYWTSSINNRQPWANFEGASPLFARRGHGVAPGFPVAEAVRRKRPQIADRIPASEDGETDLTALSQPILHGSEVVGATLVVGLRQDREVLRPQIELVQPDHMEAFGRGTWEED